MSREKIGLKQSSTISAKAAYEKLLEAGYTPRLIDPSKPLPSMNWGIAITHKNVFHSSSGKSIHMIDTTDQNRILVDLKTKGMMSEESIAFLQERTGTRMKSPAP